MLGIADLHTHEAVAAAESAMAGYQPVIPLAVGSIDLESDDSSDKDNDCDEHDASDKHDGKTSSMKLRRSGSAKDKSSIYGKEKPTQRPKIVDMDVCQ